MQKKGEICKGFPNFRMSLYSPLHFEEYRPTRVCAFSGVIMAKLKLKFNTIISSLNLEKYVLT